jgi:hypothetical protein
MLEVHPTLTADAAEQEAAGVVEQGGINLDDGIFSFVLFPLLLFLPRRFPLLEGYAGGTWLLTHLAEILSRCQRVFLLAHAHTASALQHEILIANLGDEMRTLLPPPDADPVVGCGTALTANQTAPFPVGSKLTARITILAVHIPEAVTSGKLFEIFSNPNGSRNLRGAFFVVARDKDLVFPSFSHIDLGTSISARSPDDATVIRVIVAIRRLLLVDDLSTLRANIRKTSVTTCTVPLLHPCELRLTGWGNIGDHEWQTLRAGRATHVRAIVHVIIREVYGSVGVICLRRPIPSGPR